LNSKFDEKEDNYTDFYEVYLLNEKQAESKSWESEIPFNNPCLGTISISEVKFDFTRRKEMEVDVLDKFGLVRGIKRKREG
jgi:hypothetical protein